MILKFNDKQLSVAKNVALVGIMAATLECGKFVLSFLPNIEVVTLLCAIYGYVFGIYGVIASLVFVCIEPLIYGIGSWILTYFIYWPLVAFTFMLLRKKDVKNRVIIFLAAICLTVFFGILSSIVDVAFLTGINKNYFTNVLIYYVRGILFYSLQIVCNAVLFPTLFFFLSEKIEKMYRQIKD